MASKKHQHKWVASHYSGYRRCKITFRCSCKAQFERAMTKVEQRFYSSNFDSLKRPPREKDVHAVWHDFVRRFRPGDDRKWKDVGYSLMEKVRRWASKYPDDVRLSHVDDEFFSNSMFILVEHQAEAQYMGTSVVYIPQCTGENPIVFFLYPGDRKQLISELGVINRLGNARAKIAAKESRRLATEWAKIVKLPDPHENSSHA